MPENEIPASAQVVMPVYIPMDVDGAEKLSIGGAVLEKNIITIKLNDSVGAAMLTRMLASGKLLALSFTSLEDKERMKAAAEAKEAEMVDDVIEELEISYNEGDDADR